MLMYWRVHCAFSSVFALSRTRLRLFQRAPKSLGWAIAVSLLAVGAVAQDADDGPLDKFLNSTQTLKADFSQTIYDGAGEVLEESSGIMAISRPNRFYWRYQGWTDQLIVADGQFMWIYDEDLAQATRAPLDEILAATPAMLLSGGGDFRDGFELVTVRERNAVTRVVLKPTRPETDFQEIQLLFSGDSLLAMELKDGLSQLTRIEFRNVESNPPLDEALFKFEPPEGVDVIGQGG